jgi:hypothetical protein
VYGASKLKHVFRQPKRIDEQIEIYDIFCFRARHLAHLANGLFDEKERGSVRGTQRLKCQWEKKGGEISSRCK